MKEFLLALATSNPEKALDVLSRLVDLARDHQPIRDALVKLLEKA